MRKMTPARWVLAGASAAAMIVCVVAGSSGGFSVALTLFVIVLVAR